MKTSNDINHPTENYPPPKIGVEPNWWPTVPPEPCETEKTLGWVIFELKSEISSSICENCKRPHCTWWFFSKSSAKLFI
jgi:predicted RNA-binding Zn ribbon-like protein